ncbi:hypothetical protein AB0M02_22455 [Actinoplanes sp. NPDC051861]|uniref:hypothetical protein n=1 Tax=Actinoplanes sp. NPDC051861 TaxID=3155170 RepID=UPI00342496DD
MTSASERGVPVRADLWRPDDEVLNSVIAKCLAEAQTKAGGEGGSPVLIAGGLILSALGLTVALGTGKPLLAFAVVAALAVVGIAYVAMKSAPVTVDRTQVLTLTGGPGFLPAGYLVYPPAWQAGMEEYVSTVSDRHLRIAVRLCREYPGSVCDLLRMVRRTERYVDAHAHGKAVTENEVVRAATRIIKEQMAQSPTRVLTKAK